MSETGDLYSTTIILLVTAGDTLGHATANCFRSRCFYVHSVHFGDTAPTVQQQTGPEVFHSLTPDPVAQVQEQQANYDFYQDNSSDDNSGQTDGTQTGGETSHAGGYGGFADDTAATNSDSGGGGGGK